MTKKVAIVGAGVCGILGTKSCLEEGFEPVCFEKTDKCGGLWHYRENTQEGVGCIMKSTITNTSKEMTCFSDFPIPDHYPNYMHHSQLLEYFHSYVKKFDVEKHIRYQHEVISIRKAPEFDTNGEWLVTFKDNKNDRQNTDRFQAVMLCNGHYADKYIPLFPGSDQFKGIQIHSLEYKEPTGYEDKRVVIVGLGNSACDVAVELSRTAKQVHLSTRRGGWILGRFVDGGYPFDLMGQRRFLEIVKRILGPTILNKVLRKEVNKQFDHNFYGLAPAHEFLAQHPVVNDELPLRIMCGAVQIRPNIQRFTETGVVFEDGNEVEADVIIYATGYRFGFPFLEEDMIQCDDGVGLYQYVFPPEVSIGTLAVIGCCAPWGSVSPIAELQARWACQVFKGSCKLPSCTTMRQHITRHNEAIRRKYVRSARHCMEVEWIPYMDQLAQEFGAKPSLGKLMFRDPKLFIKVLFGTCTPYQYRLTGPGASQGAREAIMTQWQRVSKPLATRPLPNQPVAKSVIWSWKSLFALGLIIAVIYLFFFS